MPSPADNHFDTATKADVLRYLAGTLHKARVEPLLSFELGQWQDDPAKVLDLLTETFDSGRLVVRSSALDEDGQSDSAAGKFASVLNVGLEPSQIAGAVETVLDSYRRYEILDRCNQVLVQTQTENVSYCGVVFTRQIETNAPYYVINYDDSGHTDSVTGGIAGRVLYVSHFNPYPLPAPWQNLIAAIQEIEEIYPDTILDVEFAIDSDDQVVIFQVRPLTANQGIERPDDELFHNVLQGMAAKFRRYNRRIPHLAGEGTLFGDMPDWNPSEIIGSRPNTLDYSLYSFLIMNGIWHEARTSLGYYDVFPAELMLSFGRKPYVDVRASFNSMVPDSLPEPLREKLVSYYLAKLKTNPSLQDKVEFEILWTCYDFTTRTELRELEAAGFAPEEIDAVAAGLHSLTSDILAKYPDILETDLQLVSRLNGNYRKIIENYQQQEKSPWSAIYAAHLILENCKRLGTLPFSRQARIAFIAKSLMKSLVAIDVIDEDQYYGFLNTIRTVATRFKEDFVRFKHGDLDMSAFLQRYGHLRAGTYDITAARYDAMADLIQSEADEAETTAPSANSGFPEPVMKAINRLIAEHRLPGDATGLLDFIRLSIENREYAKFEFTRSLSQALELISAAGQMLGFKREDMSHVDWPSLYKYKNPEFKAFDYAHQVLGKSIERHRRERRWYDLVILPPVIASAKDLFVVSPYRALPNFITSKSTEGEILCLDSKNMAGNSKIEGRIVLLENADPGYDWIFTKNPLAIVTCYGGVASHMAIRCAEFGIPAAIGTGQVIYNLLARSTYARLDCERKLIAPQIID